MMEKTVDSIQRNKFVISFLELVESEDNCGVTPQEFFEYLQEKKIPSKSKKKNGDPYPPNDFVTTLQKLSQDYGVICYYDGSRSENRYFIDDKSAKYLRLHGRMPKTALMYSPSKRGLERRMNVKKRHVTLAEAFPQRMVQSFGRNETGNDVESDSDSDYDDAEMESLSVQPSSPELQSTGSSSEVQSTSLSSEVQPSPPNSPVSELDFLDFDMDVYEALGSSLSSNDYSLNECLSFVDVRSPIHTYCYEKRFYFVTMFLLRERILKDLSSVTSITQDDLSRWQENLEKKYSHESIPVEDETENPVINYCAAMQQSFMYPMMLTPPELKEYWLDAMEFHGGTAVTEELKKRLVSRVPKRR